MLERNYAFVEGSFRHIAKDLTTHLNDLTKNTSHLLERILCFREPCVGRLVIPCLFPQLPYSGCHGQMTAGYISVCRNEVKDLLGEIRRRYSGKTIRSPANSSLKNLERSTAETLQPWLSVRIWVKFAETLLQSWDSSQKIIIYCEERFLRVETTTESL